MIMPNFEQWADAVIQAGRETYEFDLRIKEALEQAFEQGRNLGLREAGAKKEPVLTDAQKTTIESYVHKIISSLHDEDDNA